MDSNDEYADDYEPWYLFDKYLMEHNPRLLKRLTNIETPFMTDFWGKK